MKGFILGAVFGIMICTVGFSGIAQLFDKGVAKVQDVTKEAIK
jgi:flagellar biosynthesis protein FliR